MKKLLRFISREKLQSEKELFCLLEKRAIETSCRFIEQNSDHSTNYYSDHWEMRLDAFNSIQNTGLLLEFGVNRGRSANFFCEMLDKKSDPRDYYGFDTFTGLTEDWGGGCSSRNIQ